MKQQQGKNLQRIQESSVLVDDAKPIGIAVCRQAHVALRLRRRGGQRLQLRHHRFGIDASKQRIEIAHALFRPCRTSPRSSVSSILPPLPCIESTTTFSRDFAIRSQSTSDRR